MAKVGTGTQSASKASVRKETIAAAAASISADGPIDYVSLYNKVDELQTKSVGKHAEVNAAQIRKIINGLFAGGKTEVAVAKVCMVVDIAFGLKKDDATGIDNRVANASVRSAGKAEGKYKIVSVNGAATFMVNDQPVKTKVKTVKQ
jgi:hypothetical protein